MQFLDGENWWWKMNEVHDKLLEKLDESCCEDCITEEGGPEHEITVGNYTTKVFLYVWFCTKSHECK